MIQKPAILVLANGEHYDGMSVGADGDCVGELVFNTSMTGYQEMLTDPSYARQIITLTTAHVGNTGCNREDMESNKIWAAGLVMRECAIRHSNYRAETSFPDWLKHNNIVAISGIDTRDLTLKLRTHGAMGACISTHIDEQRALELARSFQGMQGLDLATEVSRKTQEEWQEGQGLWGQGSEPLAFHVVAYDFGVKHSILKILHDKGCRITLVPANTEACDVLSLHPDGIFLSNGPGDPEPCTQAIAATQVFLEHNIPIFGICLGFQILALACGGLTQKMKFGHHGANHPVVETDRNKRVLITSQNHGFAVDEEHLPACLAITHRSLFDKTLQGIRHKNKPAFGFQGHPEASPGPHDIGLIFNEFIELMKERKS
jgi:carbamoyl-phosphate synthase small subunit